MNKKEYRELKNKINTNHPELQDGEVWLTNVFIGTMENGHIPILLDYPNNQLEGIGWLTKRTGIVAYTADNQISEANVPVFVQRVELEKAHINMRTILPKATTI